MPKGKSWASVKFTLIPPGLLACHCEHTLSCSHPLSFWVLHLPPPPPGFLLSLSFSEAFLISSCFCFPPFFAPASSCLHPRGAVDGTQCRHALGQLHHEPSRTPFCLFSHRRPFSSCPLPSLLSPLFPSFPFHISPLHFLQVFCSRSLLFLSAPVLLLPPRSPSHCPACSCVPALGDPLPIHHYFHGYLAGFSVRSGRLESREVIECLYACREGLDYRDFESLGKGMKV